MKLIPNDAKDTHVYAAFIIGGSPEAVADMIGRVLSNACADEDLDACQYFGLSHGKTGESVEGSHFTDGEISSYLIPLANTHPDKVAELDGAELFHLVLVGRADGLKKPLITPPLMDETGEVHTYDLDLDSTHGEAYDFGSVKGSRFKAMLAATPKSLRKE